MKKGIVVLAVVCVLLSLASCGGAKSKDTKSIEAVETVEPEVTTESSTDSIVYIESDPLPELWYGKWVCVYSEANYFNVDETIVVKDFDNSVLYTDTSGGQPWEVQRWFCYNKNDSIIHIFNEEPPFDEGWIRESFNVKKESDTEIILTRLHSGEEVRFKKVEETEV